MILRNKIPDDKRLAEFSEEDIEEIKFCPWKNKSGSEIVSRTLFGTIASQ